MMLDSVKGIVFQIANRVHAQASSSCALLLVFTGGGQARFEGNKKFETLHDRASNKSKLAASALLFKFVLLDEVLSSAEPPVSSELFLSEMTLRLRCSRGICTSCGIPEHSWREESQWWLEPLTIPCGRAVAIVPRCCGDGGDPTPTAAEGPKTLAAAAAAVS